MRFHPSRDPKPPPRAVLWSCIVMLAVPGAGPATGGQDSGGQTGVGRIVEESGFRGGLVVEAGIGDTAAALSLGREPNVIFHGLATDPGLQGKLRREIREAGCYGRVSIDDWGGGRLPHADGTVNLLLVPDEACSLPAEEVDRVLAPGGSAWTWRDGKPAPCRKAPSAETDTWTHARYDASGNAVSRDRRVGPPQWLQWEALPRWNHGTKTSNLVTADGRIFYILDDSHFATNESSWSVIARDAHNGIRLWRRELDGWGGSKGGKKVGPAQINRRLVVSGDRVFVTLGEFAPVSVLDAATGEVLRVLEGTEAAEEFVLAGDVLLVLVNTGPGRDFWKRAKRDLLIVAADPATGRRLWQHRPEMVLPLTMASDGRQVVYHDGRVIRSLDLRTGGPLWSSPPTGQKVALHDQANPDQPGAEKATILLAPQFAPTLIIYDGVVAFAGGRQLNVVSAEDGRELWRTPYAASNYSAPVDLFGFDGHLWGPAAAMNMWRPLDDKLSFVAYDPHTGEPAGTVSGQYGFKFQHHRCHQMKVVGETVLGAKAGVEFLDTRTGALASHHWVRGSCYYGVMPANGLLYVPPHNCACYVRAKLSGFMALAPAMRRAPAPVPAADRLERGPAFGKVGKDVPAPRPGDWPTYRHDSGRSGTASTDIGADLVLGWEARLEAPLTSPVAADGRVFVASTEAHRLHALGAADGELLWQAEFGGRIDSPPTVHGGLVLCGCRDGTVSALRAGDGALVWRFTAAPSERLIVSRGQLESAWPVPGGILVTDGIAWFAAGRSSYLDGGIRLYGLDPDSGRVVVEKTLWTRDADGSEQIDEQSVDGFLNDILSADGQRVFMRHQAFDPRGEPTGERVAHLHGADGFLSSDTTTRLQWTYAPVYTSPHQGAFYDLRLSRMLFPSGRILVEDGDTIFGHGQNHFETPRADTGGRWAVFAADKKSAAAPGRTAVEYRKLALTGKQSVRFRWWREVPVHAWGLLKTRELLFVAGPRGEGATSQAAIDGKTGAVLLAISADDGEIAAEMALPSTPVWDGMAAAAGRMFVSLADGRVVALWDAASGEGGTPLKAAGWATRLPPLVVAGEPGLVGRWRCDEGIGMLARDCSGREHHAVVAGEWSEAEEGACLKAGGTPRAAVIRDAPELRFGNGDFSILIEVKLEGHDVRLLGKEAFPENWWVINALGDGRAELVLGEGRGGGNNVRVATGKPLPLGEWTSLAAVVDRKAGEVRWFVNGEPEGRGKIPESMRKGVNGGDADIAIPSKHKPFHGMFRELRIYRRALGAAEVGKMREFGSK